MYFALSEKMWEEHTYTLGFCSKPRRWESGKAGEGGSAASKKLQTLWFNTFMIPKLSSQSSVNKCSPIPTPTLGQMMFQVSSIQKQIQGFPFSKMYRFHDRDHSMKLFFLSSPEEYQQSSGSNQGLLQEWLSKQEGWDKGYLVWGGRGARKIPKDSIVTLCDQQKHIHLLQVWL